MSKREEKIFEECEKVRCVICMEYPHQAILLLCPSHENGCRPYFCGTGPGHSRCFSKFKISSEPKIVCPLCRGKVRDWMVDSWARCYLNYKPRTCAHETCEFSGTYIKMKNHVKMVHSSGAGPSTVEPVLAKEDSWDLEYYASQLELNRNELENPLQRWISGSR